MKLKLKQLYSTVIADPPWPYKAPGQFGCTLEHRPNRDDAWGNEHKTIDLLVPEIPS